RMQDPMAKQMCQQRGSEARTSTKGFSPESKQIGPLLRLVLLLSLCCVWTARPAKAQTSDSGLGDVASPSLAVVAKAMHATIRRNLSEASMTMPAEEYGFKPTPQVRSFGGLIGHIASANFFFCSQVRGERPPSTTNYESVTGKTALVKALSDSLI